MLGTRVKYCYVFFLPVSSTKLQRFPKELTIKKLQTSKKCSVP